MSWQSKRQVNNQNIFHSMYLGAEIQCTLIRSDRLGREIEYHYKF
jgi:hypothetical protein